MLHFLLQRYPDKLFCCLFVSAYIWEIPLTHENRKIINKLRNKYALNLQTIRYSKIFVKNLEYFKWFTHTILEIPGAMMKPGIKVWVVWESTWTGQLKTRWSPKGNCNGHKTESERVPYLANRPKFWRIFFWKICFSKKNFFGGGISFI